MPETQRGYIPAEALRDVPPEQSAEINKKDLGTGSDVVSAEDLAISVKKPGEERVYLLRNVTAEVEAIPQTESFAFPEGKVGDVVLLSEEKRNELIEGDGTGEGSSLAGQRKEKRIAEQAEALRKAEAFKESLVGMEVKDVSGNAYRFEKLLGVGAMGFVVKAEVLKSGQERAIKFVRPEVKGSERVIERFEKEIVASGRLQNPFILKGIDRVEVEINGQSFVGFVTEFVDGPDLNAELRSSEYQGKKGRMDPAVASEYLAEIAVAISAMNQADMVHRDLKPANIFLQNMHDRTKIVRLGDFGIVKLLDGQQEEQEEPNEDPEFSERVLDANLTGVGTIIGTPHFMSPEQIRGEPLSNKSDIYSAGVMFYLMLTGEYPFQESSQIDFMKAHLSKQPRNFSEVDAQDVPEELQDLIMQMLAKDPEARPQSGLEVYTKIKEWIAKAHPERLHQTPFDNQFDGIDQSYYYGLSRGEQYNQTDSKPDLKYEVAA